MRTCFARDRAERRIAHRLGAAAPSQCCRYRPYTDPRRLISRGSKEGVPASCGRVRCDRSGTGSARLRRANAVAVASPAPGQRRLVLRWDGAALPASTVREHVRCDRRAPARRGCAEPMLTMSPDRPGPRRGMSRRARAGAPALHGHVCRDETQHRLGAAAPSHCSWIAYTLGLWQRGSRRDGACLSALSVRDHLHCDETRHRLGAFRAEPLLAVSPDAPVPTMAAVQLVASSGTGPRAGARPRPMRARRGRNRAAPSPRRRRAATPPGVPAASSASPTRPGPRSCSASAPRRRHARSRAGRTGRESRDHFPARHATDPFPRRQPRSSPSAATSRDRQVSVCATSGAPVVRRCRRPRPSGASS